MHILRIRTNLGRTTRDRGIREEVKFNENRIFEKSMDFCKLSELKLARASDKAFHKLI